MIFTELGLAGAFVIEPERREDERGYFARTYCAREFHALGLTADWSQCATSHNRRKGTIRGLHFQRPPFGETKLVRCTRGAIHDVIVDIRPSSATYGRSFATELSAENARMVYLPDGFAHGFQTLTDACDVFYQISEPYRDEASDGIRFDDPALAIRWPLPVSVVSPRDAALPTLETVTC